MIPTGPHLPGAGRAPLRIDAVLPVAAADVRRAATVLRPSLDRRLAQLRTCYVVTPTASVADADRELGGDRWVVVDEHDWVPDLAVHRERIWRSGAGWSLQQIVKLLACRFVATPTYLTLDADVVAVRAVRDDDLDRDGRAPVFVQGGDLHAKWYRWVEQRFGYRRLPEPPGRTHAVTPSVLVTDAASLLLEELGDGNDRLAVRTLVTRLPWTEYALYYSYLEHHGLLDRFHVEGPQRLYGGGLWRREDVAHWDPATRFGDDPEHCFTVLQSTAVTTDEARSLVGGWL